MAVYNVKVMDQSGKSKRMTVESISEEKARERMKSEGYIIQEIKEQGAKSKGFQKKVKDKDLAVFCKQFGSVLNAGVTIINALEMMGDQMDNKTLQAAVREAQAYVQKGGSLADAKGRFLGGCVQTESEGVSVYHDQHDGSRRDVR